MTDNGKWTDSRKWGVIIVGAAMTFLLAAAFGLWPVALAVLFISARMMGGIGVLCLVAWGHEQQRQKPLASNRVQCPIRTDDRPRGRRRWKGRGQVFTYR